MSAGTERSRIRIGLDVGGTFTDLFLLDQVNGNTVRHKLPSTPADPYRAPVQGLAEILELAQAKPVDVQFIGLGTTVATNALLERKGAATALVTTEGFRDLLEIGRQRRPHAYDPFSRRPAPIVPRSLRFEIRERMGPDGSVITPLDEAGVGTVIERIRESSVQSVAVCFLNSYANPAHERRVSEMIRAALPEVTVSSSQELIPEFREYERLSSTVVNAYLMPVMKRYLTRFSEEVRRLGVPDAPFVMSSGGGIVSPEVAAERPIDLLLSGPSGGVSAALHLASLCGYRNAITFDMGGTSTDVCLIQDARAQFTHGRTIDALPIRTTAVDVHTVGSGGSSIAWIDEGGLLHVGPHSAGANPGPACYGNPGARATVTDANVVLGRLNQQFLLDGALRIDADLSRQAIESGVAAPKGMGLHEAAGAILAVSSTNIAQAIRFVSVERGLDPKDFILVAFGGAGPLHAAAVARELEMDVLVPPAPGVLCAMGVLTKDVQIDLSQTRLLDASAPGARDQIASIFAELERRAREGLRQALSDAADPVLERGVDARYLGQNFELTVPVPEGAIDVDALGAVAESFHAAHEQLYGYRQAGASIELVTFRLKAVIPAPRPNLMKSLADQGSQPPAPRARRDVHFESAGGFVNCPVFTRADVAAGWTLAGPAIVEQMDTTIVVPPGYEGRSDEWGNLLLKRKPEPSQ